MFRVSSVLNRDNKQFGKSHMFDGKEDTCWNSDEVCIVLVYHINPIYIYYNIWIEQTQTNLTIISHLV